MKRIDRIYCYVQDKMKQLPLKERTIESGVTTSEVSQALDIQRTNASKDLNELVRQEKLVKVDGRPVRYIDKQLMNGQLFSQSVSSDKENKWVSNATKAVDHHSKRKYPEEDIFKEMIGSAGSMKTPVEQAKAAIMYPPKGLNCLITGATGSGKTYFAHSMFQFALSNQIVAANKKLIVFNCADYAHNPELLMSHLFGYIEGAFTGATKEKAGLIDEANGSILFLDEVHRLPPEGQEMIFYFMDHGLYSRLGETTKNRQADVRIICATTENPTSSLLSTFVRRIPIIIQLPNFSSRPAREKIDLLKVMVSMEASRIQRKISLSEDVVKALIGSVSYGNVGQLKSNVQLVTARGFLKYMDQEEIALTMDELTGPIKEGMLQLANDRESLVELSKYLEPKMVVTPNEALVTIQSDSYELPYNLYEIIGDKAALLKEDGLDQEAINNFITTDINVHLKSFYKNHGFTFDTESKLTEIVEQRIIDVTKEMYGLARESLDYPFQSNFIYAMSLHISSFLKRIQMGDQRQLQLNENIRNMVLGYPKEFEVAKEMKRIIERTYQQKIPEYETYYLAVLLISLRENIEKGRIGVVVAAHGESTASSMVQVVAQLLNIDNIKAVDMPLEMEPKEAFNRIVSTVKKVDAGSGVMLLVDMGSLATFTDEIIRQTGIEVRMIDMVTTPIVLETARKTTLIDTQLDLLYESLKNFLGYTAGETKSSQKLSTDQRQVIVAICASGQGTAVQMKELIETALPAPLDMEIEVIPLSVLEMEQALDELQAKCQVIAVTGIVDPKIAAPFLSMETFFSGDIASIIEQLLNENNLLLSAPVLDKQTAKQLCLEYIDQSFTFINPTKVIEPLWNYATMIQKECSFLNDESSKIHLVMHLAGMLERIVRQDSLSAEKTEVALMKKNSVYDLIKQANQQIEEIFYLTIPETETYYTVQLLLNLLEKPKDTLNGYTKIDTLI